MNERNLKTRFIVLFMVSDPMIYPPTINAANILAEKGWRVFLIGIKSKTWEKINLSKGVSLVYFGDVRQGILNVIQYFLVHIRLLHFLWKKRVKFCMAYDASSVSPVYWACKLTRIKWGYHNHDLYQNPKGWQKYIKLSECRYARKADIISFPQANRAEIFRKEAFVSKEISIVWNGPRYLYGKIADNPNVPELNDFRSFLEVCPKVMIYQGGLSRHFNLDILLDVLAELPEEVGICILGKELENGIKNRMKLTIEQKKLTKRVLLLNGVPYDYLPLITQKCFIGLSKFTHSNEAPVNDYYLAGASNKVAEYVACGLPVISPDTEINRIFYKEFPVGLLCNPIDPLDIAKKVNQLLSDTVLYEEISEQNKLLFKTTLNFDKQFEKILRQIESYS